VICARGEAALEQAYRTLKVMGAEVLALPCDVSDQAQVNELVRHATRAFGRIDIVFYRLPSTVYYLSHYNFNFCRTVSLM